MTRNEIIKKLHSIDAFDYLDRLKRDIEFYNLTKKQILNSLICYVKVGKLDSLTNKVDVIESILFKEGYINCPSLVRFDLLTGNFYECK